MRPWLAASLAVLASAGACATSGSEPTNGAAPSSDAGGGPADAASAPHPDGAACGHESEPCCGSLCDQDLVCNLGYCFPGALLDAASSAQEDSGFSEPIDAWVQPPGCATGLTQCGTACLDVTSDVHNCGACGHDCLGQPCQNSACTPIVLSKAFVAPGRLTRDAQNLYFTNGDGAVRSVPLAGGATSTLVTGQAGPEGIAVDGTNVYFANNGDGTIKVAPLQGGSGSATLLAQQQVGPWALQVDATNVYWTTLGSGAGNGTLGRCAKTGCSLTPTILASDLQASYGMRLDSTNVYWSTLDNGGLVQFIAEKGGSETAVATELGEPLDIALAGNAIVILTYGAPGRVLLAPTPGTPPPDGGLGGATLLVGGQNFAKNVFADSVNAYWTLDNPTSTGGTVFECPLTGCGTQALLLAYGTQPCEAITSDGTFVYWLSNDGTVLKTPK